LRPGFAKCAWLKGRGSGGLGGCRRRGRGRQHFLAEKKGKKERRDDGPPGAERWVSKAILRLRPLKEIDRSRVKKINLSRGDGKGGEKGGRLDGDGSTARTCPLVNYYAVQKGGKRTTRIAQESNSNARLRSDRGGYRNHDLIPMTTLWKRTPPAGGKWPLANLLGKSSYRLRIRRERVNKGASSKKKEGAAARDRSRRLIKGRGSSLPYREGSLERSRIRACHRKILRQGHGYLFDGERKGGGWETETT